MLYKVLVVLWRQFQYTYDLDRANTQGFVPSQQDSAGNAHLEGASETATWALNKHSVQCLARRATEVSEKISFITGVISISESLVWGNKCRRGSYSLSKVHRGLVSNLAALRSVRALATGRQADLDEVELTNSDYLFKRELHLIYSASSWRHLGHSGSN